MQSELIGGLEIKEVETRFGGQSYQVWNRATNKRLASCRSMEGALKWIKDRYPHAVSSQNQN